MLTEYLYSCYTQLSTHGSSPCSLCLKSGHFNDFRHGMAMVVGCRVCLHLPMRAYEGLCASKCQSLQEIHTSMPNQAGSVIIVSRAYLLLNLHLLVHDFHSLSLEVICFPNTNSNVLGRGCHPSVVVQ